MSVSFSIVFKITTNAADETQWAREDGLFPVKRTNPTTERDSSDTALAQQDALSEIIELWAAPKLQFVLCLQDVIWLIMLQFRFRN